MCLRPITKKICSVYGPVRYTKIPCGKCLECLRAKQNEWLIRLYCESLYSSSVLFFTLTYDETSVPTLLDDKTGEITKSVYKKHVQDWLKRFRIRLERNGLSTDWKYFICSEYGPATKRPHYHGLIFNLPKKHFVRYGLTEWLMNYGFYDCKEIIMATDLVQREKNLSCVMRYVSKYCMKGEFENPLVDQRKVFPTFRLISKGIGKEYILNIKDYVTEQKEVTQGFDYSPAAIQTIIDRSKVKIGSCYYSFPKYFKNYAYGEKTKLSYEVSMALLQRDDDLYRDKLAQIQADWNCDSLQAFRIMAMQKSSTQQLEEKKLRKVFEKYYYQSKL